MKTSGQDFDKVKDACFATVMKRKCKEIAPLVPVAVWMWAANPVAICTPVLSQLCEVIDSWVTTVQSEIKHWTSIAIRLTNQMTCKASFIIPFEYWGIPHCLSIDVPSQELPLLFMHKRETKIHYIVSKYTAEPLAKKQRKYLELFR